MSEKPTSITIDALQAAKDALKKGGGPTFDAVHCAPSRVDEVRKAFKSGVKIMPDRFMLEHQVVLTQRGNLVAVINLAHLLLWLSTPEGIVGSELGTP